MSNASAPAASDECSWLPLHSGPAPVGLLSADPSSSAQALRPALLSAPLPSSERAQRRPLSAPLSDVQLPARPPSPPVPAAVSRNSRMLPCCLRLCRAAPERWPLCPGPLLLALSPVRPSGLLQSWSRCRRDLPGSPEAAPSCASLPGVRSCGHGAGPAARRPGPLRPSLRVPCCGLRMRRLEAPGSPSSLRRFLECAALRLRGRRMPPSETECVLCGRTLP